jgi:hypothetical protein
LLDDDEEVLGVAQLCTVWIVELLRRAPNKDQRFFTGSARKGLKTASSKGLLSMVIERETGRKERGVCDVFVERWSGTKTRLFVSACSEL